MSRLWVWPLLFLTALLLPGPAAVRASDTPRIVAVGDLHGDYDAWRAIAGAAGLMDGKGKWAGGRTIFVQLGDITDRGPDSLKIAHDLMRLQREAPRRGGRVVALVGNHEAMNMTDDLRYVHPGEFEAFVDRNSKKRRERVYQANLPAIDAFYRPRILRPNPGNIKAEWLKTMPLGKVEHQLAWSPTGELGRWTLHNPAVVKIGDTLFVHGGISAAYATIPIGEINKRVAAALAAQDKSPTAIINDPHGPLWYRGLITRSGDDETTAAPVVNPAAPTLTIDQEIDLVLRSQGAKRIIVAHTPSLTGIISSSGGRLWRVDSGNSRAYGGIPSYLEIVGDRVTAHAVQRPAGAPWGAGQ